MAWFGGLLDMSRGASRLAPYLRTRFRHCRPRSGRPRRIDRLDSQVPVLLVVFNRPKQTRQVVNALRQVKPRELFVAADGPRKDRPGEETLCRLAREAATDLDWPCEVETRFLDENTGCGPAVSSAISWFFQHVEHGIILEDDCVPHPHLFPFFRQLLGRYLNDERIMAINGFAPYPIRKHPYDYHFSRRFRCWGWGTWRRAWRYFSYDLKEVDEETFHRMVSAYYPFHYGRQRWLEQFREAKTGQLKTWAFRWEVACFSQSGLFIAPERSLITNIGFGPDATHTQRPHSLFAKVRTHAVGFPIRHPPFVYADGVPERNLERAMYKACSLKGRCGVRFRHLLGTVTDYAQTLP
jgi:hypothetical protein